MSSYCEMPEFYSDSEPVARKEHHCIECAAPILKGEKHYSYNGKWAGEFGSGRQHLLCRDICVYIRDHFNGRECFAFGELMEFWGDELYFERAGERKQPFSDRSKEVRHMMAKVLWRQRRFRRRLKISTGVVSARWEART